MAPGSRGLFQQAMMRSGSCYSQTEQQAEASGATLASAVGCGAAATAVACLRRTSVSALIDAPAPSFALVHGTPTLPADPAVAVAAGKFARVPIVIGSNRDEGRTFAQGYIGSSQADYDTFVTSSFGARAPAVLAHYPWPATSDQFPSFDNGTPIAPTFNAAERRLARDMKAAWAGFAFRGTPGWPSYSRNQVFYSLRAGGASRVISDAAFAAEHQCGFWDGL